jgi:photosystem II stability/assembly factor-like uncharacterized protein
MKPKASLVVLIFTLWVMTTLMGCASPTANKPGPTPTQRPAVELATTTPLPPDRIAATSFIDADRGWAVGEVADGGGSLVQRTTDGGRTWEVLYADGAGFPLTDVCFTDDIHGWAVSSSGTLVGFIIATTDGGRTWAEQYGAGPLLSVDFSDALHGTVEGWDGDSPQRPITLTTSDGGRTWSVQLRD